MTEGQLGKVFFAAGLFFFGITPAFSIETNVSALMENSLKNHNSASSLKKSETKLTENLHGDHLDPNTTADALAALARTCWLLGDRSPVFDRFENNQDWFNKADPLKRMRAALWIARLEVDHDRAVEAEKWLELVDQMNAPTCPKRDVRVLHNLYGRLLITDTLAAMSDEKKDVVAKLADATSFVSKPDADQDQTPEYLLALARVCQRQKMKTTAAAFARQSARLSLEAANGQPGEPYCLKLDLLAQLDEANGELTAATNDRLASLDYSTQFHGKESPLTQARVDEFKKIQAKLQDLKRNPPVKEDNPSIRLHGVPSWELTLGRGAGRELLGDREGAEALYQESLKTADEAGSVAGRTERPLNALAGLCNEQERFPEAENFARRALELCDKRTNEPEEYRVVSLGNLFQALWGEGKFSEARPIAMRLKKMVTDGKLQRGEAAQVLMFSGMTERLFGEETAAYDDLTAALKLSEIDPKSVWIPKYYLLWQSAAVLDQINNSATALALMKEAKRLFNKQDISISDRQRARFYAAVATRECCGNTKEEIRDWTEAVRFAKSAYGPEDCHTKNYIDHLKAAQMNYRNRHKMKGGMFIASPCDNIDEPAALVRPPEP